MKTLQTLSLVLLSLPLSAQAWDLRLEAPFAKGQDLPGTTVQGSGQALSGSLDTGKGVIVTASHRIIRVGPVLKFEWNAEYAYLQADGRIQQGQAAASRLRQSGLGVGINAQFWLPFTDFAGELGLLERFHSYRFEGASAAEDRTIARPWLRAGLRWVLPFPGPRPYLAASYQAPLTRDKPAQLGSVQNLGAYLDAQGSGQEFQSLWTLGVGISF
jgi:hypothetical protein